MDIPDAIRITFLILRLTTLSVEFLSCAAVRIVGPDLDPGRSDKELFLKKVSRRQQTHVELPSMHSVLKS